jgi:hypothetical protein
VHAARGAPHRSVLSVSNGVLPAHLVQRLRTPPHSLTNGRVFQVRSLNEALIRVNTALDLAGLARAGWRARGPSGAIRPIYMN